MARPATRSTSSSRAVSIRTGTSELFRRTPQISQPSLFGSITSRMTKTGLQSSAACNACPPSWTTTVENPSRSRYVATRAAVLRSSSTINTVPWLPIGWFMMLSESIDQWKAQTPPGSHVARKKRDIAESEETEQRLAHHGPGTNLAQHDQFGMFILGKRCKPEQ